MAKNDQIPPHLSPHREAPNKHEKGSRKYKEWIHKESKRADDYKNLPFTFSKPKRSKPLTRSVFCTHCNDSTFVTETTVAVICRSCGKFYRVSEKNSERTSGETINIFISGADEEKTG